MGKTEYSKRVIVISFSQIDELGWKEGEELESRVEGSVLVIMLVSSPAEKPKKARTRSS